MSGPASKPDLPSAQSVNLLTGPDREKVGKRFWARVDKRGADDCWIWLGAKCGSGYGCIWFNKRLVRAHRLIYELLVSSIPEGLEIDHLCRNHACVNPAHLEPVSKKTNILRGIGFIAQQAKQTHCKRGHALDLLNTRFRKDGSRNCRKCHAEKRKKGGDKNGET